jgi:CheY-like chemotaxis protein/HPt (histidine-containing phosphotransfer) domain-containing protein
MNSQQTDRITDVPGLAALRLLCMEDDAQDAKLYIRQVQRAGLLASEDVVVSLVEFERALGEHAYDLILSDHKLVGFTGMDALSVMQRIGNDIDFIPVRGSMGEELAVVCMKRGATDFVLKDHPDRLVSAIRRALHGRMLTRCRATGIAAPAIKPAKRTDLLRLVCEALRRPLKQESQAAMGMASLPEFIRGPLRILIAEDSSDNRLLLRAYLKQTPYRLTFVEDGERAVEQFKHEQLKGAGYDLVLMDVQMPRLDGLAATRVIRAFEQERGDVPAPILALTASALADDVAASSAAGCTAHLSKPISKQKLLAEIERYGFLSEAAESSEPNITGPIVLGPIIVDAPPEVEELVPEYLADRKKEIMLFRTLMLKPDFESIRILAHNLKGNGRSFGFPELTDIGAAMEKSARAASGAEVACHVDELSNYLDRVQLRAGLVGTSLVGTK